MTDFVKLPLAACGAVLIGGAVAQASTAHGEFWDSMASLSSIAMAEAVIAGGAPTATFASTAIDYPNGSGTNINSLTSLSTFLGADGASLVGAGAESLVYSVFRFTGWLDLAAGMNLFSVSSDDGFQLKIDGAVVAAFDGNRPYSTDWVGADLGGGLKAFELIYWENDGDTGVEFGINGNFAEFADAPAVPLPAALPLLAGGLGMLAVARQRRRAA